MSKTNSGLRVDCCFPFDNIEGLESAKDSRYTQRRSSSEYARTTDQLSDDQIREPRLDEGLAFREKI